MSEPSADSFYIAGSVLHLAYQEWRDQRDDLTVATTSVRNAPTTGFGPAVSGMVASFVATWAQHGDKSVERAALAAENLQIVEHGYSHDDQTMATIFDSWPIS